MYAWQLPTLQYLHTNTNFRIMKGLNERRGREVNTPA
jgi:hypothetical protein